MAKSCTFCSVKKPHSRRAQEKCRKKYQELSTSEKKDLVASTNIDVGLMSNEKSEEIPKKNEKKIKTKKINKNMKKNLVFDVDSICVFVTPLSLRSICSIKVNLGATTFRMKGDSTSNQMCLLLAAFPSVYVDCQYREDIIKKLLEMGVVFQPAIDQRKISLKQVNVNRELIVKILSELKIPQVRVVEHGLKMKNFEKLNKITIMPSETNRFDIGITFYECETINIFKKISGAICYPMLGEHEFGSLSWKDKKIYSTVVHDLKYRANFAKDVRNIHHKRFRESVNNLEILLGEMKDNLQTGTRYEVSICANTIKEALDVGKERLSELCNFPFQQKKIYKKDYFKKIEGLFSILKTKQLLIGSNHILLSIDQKQAYNEVINAFGWSDFNVTKAMKKKHLELKNKHKKYENRNKKGRFVKKSVIAKYCKQNASTEKNNKLKPATEGDSKERNEEKRKERETILNNIIYEDSPPLRAAPKKKLTFNISAELFGEIKLELSSFLSNGTKKSALQIIYHLQSKKYDCCNLSEQENFFIVVLQTLVKDRFLYIQTKGQEPKDNEYTLRKS